MNYSLGGQRDDMVRKLFLMGLLILLATLTAVSAQVNVSFAEPGVTPDSFFYNFELFYENVQLNLFTFGTENKLQLESEYTAERLAEMHAMVEQKNYEAAQESAIEINNLLDSTENHIQELSSAESVDYTAFIENGDTVLNDLLGIQHVFMENSENLEVIKEMLLEMVGSGALDEETAALIINDAQEGISGVQTVIIEQKEEFVQIVAEENNIPELEVEAEINQKEIELGTEEIIRGDITEEEIIALETAIAKIERESMAVAEEGRQNEADTIEVLLENAKLKLQIAENALESDDIGEAFGQFTAAEHLMLNADKISGKTLSELSEQEVNQIKDNFGENAQELTDKIEIVTSRDVDEWETYKDELISKYPDRQEYFENRYEQSKKAMELAGKLNDAYFEEAENLRIGGKSDEEIGVIMVERFSDEFRKAYGEDYIPPGFVDQTIRETPVEGEETEIGGVDDGSVFIEVIPIGKIDKEFFNKYDEGGGFVEDTLYTDFVTDYRYTFREDGFSYTTPIGGETYTVKYPENYKPKTYSRGDEVYSYLHEESDGDYTYIYTSTGYEVKNPDGTKESFTYPEGKYNVVGGGEIEHKPTGFEYVSSEGTAITYDYNPEFKHYVASDGKVYVPPEGMSYHSDNTHYGSSEKTYSYSYGGETWKYNPETNAWKSSTGETYTPSAKTGAPVGYEDQKTFTTEHGEIWNYDSSSGAWKSSGGKEYTPPPSSYYSYDNGANTDYQGNTWTKENDGKWVSSGGEVRESSYASAFSDPSGKSWSYDSNTGVWQSSTGENYNSYTGTTTNSDGQAVNTYNSGGYQSSYSGGAYTDASGKTWRYDSSGGTWRSSTGESYTAPSGTPSPYSGTYSGTDSSGGTWTQGTDGTWS